MASPCLSEFKYTYRFEEMQPIRFAVYDRDSSSNDLRKHDLIGFVDTTVSSIMGKRGSTLAARLANPKHADRFNGSIVIRGSHIRGARHTVRLGLAGQVSTGTYAYPAFPGISDLLGARPCASAVCF